jgi:hypothetical protein
MHSFISSSPSERRNKKERDIKPCYKNANLITLFIKFLVKKNTTEIESHPKRVHIRKRLMREGKKRGVE